MQPVSGNHRPDLLTSMISMSFVLHLPREIHLCRSSSNVPRLPSFLDMLQNPPFCSLVARCRVRCACHAKPHLNRQKWSGHVVFCTFWLEIVLHDGQLFRHVNQKVLQGWCALYILTWTCASRHNRALFDMSTSKSAPKLVRFVHFDLEMCFAPQRRANFHLSSGQVAPHPPF